MPKHRPRRNTNNAGPKGKLVKTFHFQYYALIVLTQIKYLRNSEEALSSSEEEEQISRGKNSS